MLRWLELENGKLESDGHEREMIHACINDILGSHTGYIPKHAKQYAKVADIMSNAISEYNNDVIGGKFPTEANSFPIDESVLTGLE